MPTDPNTGNPNASLDHSEYDAALDQLCKNKVHGAITNLKALEIHLRTIPPSYRHDPSLLKAYHAIGSYLTPRRRETKELPDPAEPLIR